MKLRIKGNSIRLRLTQSEVAEFARAGRVSDQLHFGPERALVYALIRDASAASIAARYAGDELSVVVPLETARTWTETEQVGFRGEITGAPDATVQILVEKDFQCLVPRPGEDEGDHYANPLATGKQI